MFDSFLRGLPRISFSFSSVPAEFANTSAYFQSIGFIAASGAVVAALLIAVLAITWCSKQCCCRGARGRGANAAGMQEPLVADMAYAYGEAPPDAEQVRPIRKFIPAPPPSTRHTHWEDPSACEGRTARRPRA
jgi:hypothetical protein